MQVAQCPPKGYSIIDSLTHSLTHSPMNQPAPHSRVLPEYLVKDLLAVYRACRFSTMFKPACHLSTSSARLQQSTSSHPTSWTPIFILSSHLLQDLANGLFLSSFPTKTLHAFLFFPTYHMPHVPPSDHPYDISPAVQIITFLINQCTLVSCYFLPIRLKQNRYPVVTHRY